MYLQQHIPNVNYVTISTLCHMLRDLTKPEHLHKYNEEEAVHPLYRWQLTPLKKGKNYFLNIS